jgi:hypothetical protein
MVFNLLLELACNQSGLHHMTTQCRSECLEAIQHARVAVERAREAESAACVAACHAAWRAAWEQTTTF